MCGICGVLQWEPFVDKVQLAAMSQAIAHRGPDQAGYWQDDKVALGFRRLAIIDLTPSGHQPMTNETSDLWLVYNGEVYNYPELRRQLEAKGHKFISQTDTECLLHGYEQWGFQVIEQLRGMFAFALWDQPRQTLLLARDRVGIKPLYYYWDGKKFAFGSEIKALQTLPQIDLSVDSSALWDYLTYLYIPHPKTIYRNIRQVPPGHYLVKQPDSAPKIYVYWDLDEWGLPVNSGEPKTHPDWKPSVQCVRDKLEETVQAHMLADVPVGLFLSGGIDSSSIGAFARLSHGAPIKSFSIGFDIEKHSELSYARQVAQLFESDHHEQRLTVRSFAGAAAGAESVDFAQALQQMLMLYDQPFADASGIPTLAVSKLAAEQVKVVLSGDGGDEALAGYVWYKLWFDLEQSERLSRRARALLYEQLLMPTLKALSGLPKVTGLIGKFHLDVKGKSGADRYGAMMSRIKVFQKPRLLPSLANEFRDYDDYWHFRQYWREDLDPVSRMQYVDLKTYLPDDILTKVDRASMAVSLEVRPPLLDHEFLELIASLPPEFRFDKRILRAAVSDLLPPAILMRPKKGFSSPMLDWLTPVTRNGARLGGLARWAVDLLDAWHAAQ